MVSDWNQRYMKWTPDFTAYAAAHGRSPEEQDEHDRRAYPRSPWAPFIAWLDKRAAAASKAAPTDEQLRRLWQVCSEWRGKVDPICRESIWQDDQVNLACPDLALAVCETLGWPDRCGMCGESLPCSCADAAS